MRINSLTHEMLDVFAGNREHVHVRFDRPEADQAFGKQLAGAEFELLRAQLGHALEDMLPLADMRALVRANKIGDVQKKCVLTLASGVDQVVDRFQDADLPKEIDLRHGK